MMNNRVTIISLIIIACAALLYVYSGRQPQDSQSRQWHSFINPESITLLEITKGQQHISLKARDKRWFVTDNNSIEIAADIARVLPVFEFVNEGRIVQRMTQKESAYPSFDLAGDAMTTVALHGSDGTMQRFCVGKQKDYSSQFARKQADPYVYLVDRRLNLSAERSSWFYKKVVDYDIANLEYIAYTCDNSTTLNIWYDGAKQGFVIRDLPEGKQAKGLSLLGDQFRNLSVMEYVPRSDGMDAAPVIAHTLHFKSGAVVRLSFLQDRQEKSTRHFLDIRVQGPESPDSGLEYLRTVSRQYVFILSWFDKNRFQRGCADFFEDKPPVPDDNGTSVAVPAE